VTDRGPGLPDHSDTKVFERFYTGDAARGAGLGLAIARELAERMHGRLRVRSAERGTAFTLELPTDGNGA
jgi:signal transduction histidine kinase